MHRNLTVNLEQLCSVKVSFIVLVHDQFDPQKSHKINRRNLRSVVCTVQLGPPRGT